MDKLKQYFCWHDMDAKYKIDENGWEKGLYKIYCKKCNKHWSKEWKTNSRIRIIVNK